MKYVFDEIFNDPAQEPYLLSSMPRLEEYNEKIIPHSKGLPVLDRDQEHHLFKQMNYFKHKGMTKEALRVRGFLTRANIGLALNTVNRLNKNRKLQFDRSEAYISLIHAIDLFDFNKGTKFSTYAVTAITRDYFHNLNKVTRITEKTIDNEILSSCVDIKTLKRRNFLKKDVNNVLNVLNEREKAVIEALILRSLTQKQTAELLGISTTRVGQIKSKALAKIRKNMESGKIKLENSYV